ncbi:oligopeptide transport system ATP-binding protein [Staphylococcus auricularis]
MEMTERILEVRDLHVSFDIHAGEVQAVRSVDFYLNKGETLAIVGESGSGKSVTTKAITKLFQKDEGRIKKGEILFLGEDLATKSEKELTQLRGKEISMIFQDPMTSLNPTMKIGKQVMEPLIKHRNYSKQDAKKRALEILNLVGLPNAEKRFNAYPHQFSGGQRQRIVIATALACEPKILIADEPTTALDVTMQAQILDLMKELQAKIDTSIIFITHDLDVVANVANKVAVMYGGQMVESGVVDEIFYDPRHPYTWGLLSSMPDMETDINTELLAIPGTPPDLIKPPVGDAFAERSKYALDVDFKVPPPWFRVSPTHFVKSWLLDERAPKVELPPIVQQRLRNMPNNYDKPVKVERVAFDDKQ